MVGPSGCWQQTKNTKQGGGGGGGTMFYLNKQEQKIDECKQSLLLQLQQIKDMDSVLVESKNKSIFLQTRSQRGSKFRGVSKNGSKWQVMIVRGDIKKYIGAVESEEIAARFYDKYALIIQGFEVRMTSQISPSIPLTTNNNKFPQAQKKIFKKLRAINYIFPIPTRCFHHSHQFKSKLADPSTQNPLFSSTLLFSF